MKNLIYTIIALVATGIVFRLVPHAPNFAPVGAIAIFNGLYLPKKYALIIPVVTMFAGDLLIGFYNINIMLSVYFSLTIMAAIGIYLKDRKETLNIAAGTIIGSLFFFIITNAAVWKFGTLYPHSWDGLMNCYMMAIPFFRNTLMGDMFFTAVMVGGFEIINIYLTKSHFSVIFSRLNHVKNKIK